MIERDTIQARTAALPAAFWLVWRWFRWATGRAKRTGDVVFTWIVAMVRCPARTIIIGRHAGVSITITLLSIVLMPMIAWWVATTTGYPPIETWVTETWRGTEPHLLVFVATGLLVGLGAVSAAINAGLLPTHLLVSAPLFGLAVTRYGTQITYSTGEIATVSLPEAIEFATAIGLLGSLPITLVGFVLGGLIHYGLTHIDIPVATLRESINR